MNIVKRIRNANKGRDPERLAMKYSIMRNSSFAFLRGTCHLFYDRLPKSGICKSAPLAWCCGDLHLENFGSYKGDNRLVYFDINDFDEAALAPVSWELSRVITSILVSAETLHISPKNAQELSTQFLKSYADTISTGKAGWVEKETSRGMIKDLFAQLQFRSRADLLDGRTEKKGKSRRFRLDGKKTLPISSTQRNQVTQFMQSFAKHQPNPEFYEVLDIARNIAGTGSLGIDRYAILIKGKGSPDQNYMLDLKQASSSSIAKHITTIQPKWKNEAQRTVTLQQRMQAVSMAFLYTEVMNGQAYVLRALQPAQDRLPLAKCQKIEDLEEVMQIMAQCVAWAQLRSSGRQGSATADELIVFAQNKKWQSKLIALANMLCVQVQSDWKTYCKAYDDGEFGTAN